MYQNIHEHVAAPSNGCSIVRGDYFYYHYGCDGTNDQGWGCGYRTLQSMCSWIKCQTNTDREVPTIPEIQEALFQMGDKPRNFVGSREWIGSFEVSICADFFFMVPCKIMHIRSGKELEDNFPALVEHFTNFGSPVMMGGDTDNASKCVLGICMNTKSLLIMDPHCYENKPSLSQIIEAGLIKWRPLDSFLESSFYNLCLPQLKAKK